MVLDVPNPPQTQSEMTRLLLAKSGEKMHLLIAGLHKSFHPTIQDGSTWSKFGTRGGHGDFFLFSNLGAL